MTNETNSQHFGGSSDDGSTVVHRPSTSVAAMSEQRPARTESRYPPGISNILHRRRGRYPSDRTFTSHGETVYDVDHQISHELFGDLASPNSGAASFFVRPPRHPTPSRNVSPLTPALLDTRSPTQSTSESSDPSSRDRAKRNIRNTCQSLGAIRDGMCTVIREYFVFRIVVNCIQLPAYRPLRHALTRLISTLECLADDFDDDDGHGRFPDDREIDYLMYEITSSLSQIIEEGQLILSAWTRRGQGLKLGEPLHGEEWRLRKTLIHDSNERLNNLRVLTQNIESRIRGEQELSIQSQLRARLLQLRPRASC